MQRLGFPLAILALLGCAPRHPLEGTNVFKRREACIMMGDDPQLALEALPLLLRALQDDDAAVRWRAEFALGRLGPEGVPALIDALRGPQRRGAAFVLGPMGPHARSALPALREAAADPDPSVRLWAVHAIGQIDPADDLSRWLQDPNPDVQRIALALRPVPVDGAARFPDVPLALVLHWGLYSVAHRARPGERTERLMENEKIPRLEYEILGSGFTASRFDPDDWVRIAKEAGARAIVLTAKGRDGFCLWDTPSTEFNSVLASEAKKDLVKDLAAACDRGGLKFGLSYSVVDGHHPDYAKDSPLYFDGMHRQVEELVTKVPVWGIWFDADGGPPARRWHPDDLAAMIHRVRAQTIVDQAPVRRTFGFSRGHSENPEPLLSGERMIEELVDAVSRGRSLFIDLGPRANGAIPEPIAERLAVLGGWMSRNGEAIQSAAGSPFGGPIPAGPVTMRRNTLFVFLATLPTGPIAFPRLKNTIRRAWVVDGGAPLAVTAQGVAPPKSIHDSPYTVIAVDLDGPPRVE